MIKFSGISSVLALCILLIFPKESYSSEKLLEASVSARAEYNDNIFLTTSFHDAVSSLIITPSLSGVIKEQNWQAKLNSQLRLNQYSNHNLDSNGQLLNLTGQYSAERNVFSLSVNHDLITSLSTVSTDFGLSSESLRRKTQSITPQYTRLLTERLVLTLSYSYSDTQYLDIENDTRFISSYTETGSSALRYNLSEKDQVSLNFQAVNYTRKDKLGDIQLFDLSVGFDHDFSQTLSVDLAVGVSRRNSTNLQTTVLDFFGTIITIPQEINTKTRGSTLNLSVEQLLAVGSISGRVSRNTTTNSFGGLNETDKVVIKYDERLSSLWRYAISASYADTISVSAATTSTDREVLFLEARTNYSLTQEWSMSLSYRYRQRKFKNVSSAGEAPDSNRLQIGLTYNLPSLSTF